MALIPVRAIRVSMVIVLTTRMLAGLGRADAVVCKLRHPGIAPT